MVPFGITATAPSSSWQHIEFLVCKKKPDDFSKTTVSNDLDQLKASVEHSPVFTRLAMQAISRREATRLFFRQFLTLMAVCGALIAIVSAISRGATCLNHCLESAAFHAPQRGFLSVSHLHPLAEQLPTVDQILSNSSVISLLARSVCVVARLLLMSKRTSGRSEAKIPRNPLPINGKSPDSKELEFIKTPPHHSSKSSALRDKPEWRTNMPRVSPKLFHGSSPQIGRAFRGVAPTWSA